MRESVLIEDDDLQIISVYLRFDSNYDDYSRRVYSFGDLLGQTGGLYSAIFIIGVVLVGIFQNRLFVSSVLNKIYQVDKSRNVESNADKNKIYKSNLNKNGGKLIFKLNSNSFENIKVIH